MEGIQFKKGTRWDLTVLVMFYFPKLCGEYSSVNVIIILWADIFCYIKLAKKFAHVFQ